MLLPGRMARDSVLSVPQPALPRPELPVHYYRDNFLALCDTVQAQYDDVLSSTERLWLQRFYGLDHAAQCLYVRLVSRVGPIFRFAKLSYPEIPDIRVATDALVCNGLASWVDCLATDELAKLFTLGELRAAFGSHLRLPAGSRKQAWLDEIGLLELSGVTLHARLCAGQRDLLRVDGAEVVELMQLLFFGNRHQGMTDFVLSDMGVANYYPYPLDRANRLFICRAAVDEYLACSLMSESFYDFHERGETGAILDLAERLQGFVPVYQSSKRRWERCCHRVARELERMGEQELAFSLYSQTAAHPSRERRARILESRSEWKEAQALCEQIIADPLCEEELESAARIATRVARKQGVPAKPRPRDKFLEIRLKLAPQSASVELDVAGYLQSEWASLHFVENRLMNTLFGLAFWEQIFAPLPGAFHNPYQAAPADMYAGVFLERREAAIQSRLAQLREMDLSSELLDCHTRYAGYRCRWVDWQHVDKELLRAALAVIPPAHIIAIWHRQLFDPGENRNGFPDLIALGDAPGDYAFIEVKGPGDRLQDNQKRWLRYFARHGIPAQVAWVEWDHG